MLQRLLIHAQTLRPAKQLEVNMAWRLAKSLSVLRTEILARYPGTTVWTIGDQAHASGYSDHNPNSRDVVCAVDVKGDGGMNLQAFVDHLIRNPHPNLRYVIYNRRIYQRKNGFKAQVYTGPNAHADHAHASAGDGPDGRSVTGYDNTSTWRITSMGSPSVPSTGLVPAPPLRENDTGPRVGQLQRALNEALGLQLTVDEDYGPATTTAVRELQRRARITDDGIYGTDAAAALTTLLEDDMDLNDKLTLTQWSKDHWDIGDTTVGGALREVYAYSRDAKDKTTKLIELQEAVLAKLAGADTKSILDAIHKRAAEDAQRDATLLAEATASVRAALDPAELAAAIAEGLDTELDTKVAERAVEAALRKVFGGLDGTNA